MKWLDAITGKQASRQIRRLREELDERDERHSREINTLREEISGLRLALELLGGRDLPERKRIEAIEALLGEINARRGAHEQDVARTWSEIVALTQQHKWDIENLEKAIQGLTARMMARADA